MRSSFFFVNFNRRFAESIMPPIQIFIFVIVVFASTFGDFCLKKATSFDIIFYNWYFWGGMANYLIQAFCWTSLYKYMDFSVLGIYYSLGMLVLAVIIGVFYFGESISIYRIAGIILGLIAIFLLNK